MKNVQSLTIHIEPDNLPLFMAAVDAVKQKGFEMETEKNMGIAFDENTVGQLIYLMDVTANEPGAWILLGEAYGSQLKKAGK